MIFAYVIITILFIFVVSQQVTKYGRSHRGEDQELQDGTF